jgi:anaerobic selenocysteine-containing dehydrogenase
VGSAWWKKVIYVLNRGGRWWSYAEAWSGEQVKAKYGKLVNLYQEKPATTRNSMTGHYLKGIATYLPIQNSVGKELNHLGASLHMITHRTMVACKSRTISNYWLTEIQEENYLHLHPSDALKMGFKDNDMAWVGSVSNLGCSWDYGPGLGKPMIGRIRTTERIRPGVMSFELGYGHWAYGASNQIIDGEVIPLDERRAKGVHANAAMYVDEFTRSPLSDVVGGSAVFYDSKVFLAKP